eukprot:COSAG01_NODE_34968_length_539_cov_0.815909_1_plen_123_part_01
MSVVVLPAILLSRQWQKRVFSTNNSFLDARSTLVEAACTCNGDPKHVSKFRHVYPTLSSKVMVIGVLLGTYAPTDNGKNSPTFHQPEAKQLMECRGIFAIPTTQVSYVADLGCWNGKNSPTFH